MIPMPPVLTPIRAFFVNSEQEANAIQAMPNTLCMFVNRSAGEVYTKEFNMMGIQEMVKYKRVTPIQTPQVQPQQQLLDPASYEALQNEIFELKRRISKLEPKKEKEKQNVNGTPEK